MTCRPADVIAITETWLSANDSVNDCLLADFSVYRTDRPGHPNGGGVLLLVRRHYSHWEAPLTLCTQSVQATSCFLRVRGKLELIVCVYRSPSSTQGEDKEISDLLKRAAASAPSFVIVGDLNLPHADWEHGLNRADSLEGDLVQWVQENAFVQHVNFPTRSRGENIPSSLDVVITKYGCLSAINIEPPIGKSDHLVLSFSISLPRLSAKPRLTRNLSRINTTLLRDRATRITWVPEQEDATLEQRWHVIKSGLTQLLEEFAPLCRRQHADKPRWWRRRIDRALKRRNILWKRFHESGGFRRWLSYKRSRNLVVKLQRQAKYSYELKLAQNAKTNPKRYYSYVQSKASLREAVGNLITEDGRQITGDLDKAQELLRVFQKVHRADNGYPIPLQLHRISECKMDEIVLTASDVLSVLKDLNPYKSPGPDNVHPAIVKPIADILQLPILQLYNLSLREGRIPQDWKEAVVVAIHKGGSKSSPSNYRPVSLTSVILKCLEKIIRNRICEHLIANNLIGAEQHGFVKKKSCLTNLLCFLDEITRCLDEGVPVEVCYLDFSKAFDSVNHRFLLEKLTWFGLHPQLLSWLSAFLHGRTFRVRVGDVTSCTGTAHSGVPQGSVLGPLLFLMFINDLAPLLDDSSYLFADDLKLVSRGDRAALSKDFATVLNWSHLWDLPLNTSKCQILTSRDEEFAVKTTNVSLTLQRATEARDLGVIVACDFKPSAQCRHAANKARQELFRLRRVLSCTKAEVFLPLYKAVVRPHLEYCVQAWAPYLQKDIICIENVQRLATRMIEGQRGLSYEDRLANLGLFSMKRRRLRGDLIETFKIMKGLSGLHPTDLFEPATADNLRGHCMKLKHRRSRLELRARFFANRVVPSWNKLPSALLECETVEEFKHSLDKNWLAIFPDLP